MHSLFVRVENRLAVLVSLREGRSPTSFESATVAAASISILRVAVERWRTDSSGALLENLVRESFDAVTNAVTSGPDDS